ncbi:MULTISPECIES: PEP-CTERM sorting domain-containing protein [unclassified Colwellia]|uniref:PEP-CTERM sorting domain-containing protein n=1 Tax=unclassified Colwellia TaxID=196834 RepID=UPI002174E36A|nr:MULTISPECIES: PEP-CTERM sorting domain-containing protein [unclassified Colwellia]
MKFKFLKTIFSVLVLSMSCLTNVANAGVIEWSDDFEGPRPSELTGWDLEAMGSGNEGSFSDYGFSGTNWLRSSGISSTATLTLTGLASHTAINLDFLFAIMDSIDPNDYFNVSVDNKLVFNAPMTAWSSPSPTYGTRLVSKRQLAGTNGQYWSKDSAFDLGTLASIQNISHTASTVKIDFLAQIDEGKSNESFAIDDLSVSLVGSTAVPEPSTLAIFALGLMGIASRRFKKQA